MLSNIYRSVRAGQLGIASDALCCVCGAAPRFQDPGWSWQERLDGADALGASYVKLHTGGCALGVCPLAMTPRQARPADFDL